ncbi:MAG: hypothetical protein WCF24_02470 [Acidimicrobiales bacterium]
MTTLVMHRLVRAFIPEHSGLRRTIHRFVFERNLRKLNDLFVRRGVDDRFWLSGGLLLGWARQGGILPNDYKDADFGLRSDDCGIFCALVPDLIAGGFLPFRRFRDNDGRTTLWSFWKDGSQFDFIEYRTEEASRWFTGYFDFDGASWQVIGKVPDGPLERISFLGRWWWKPGDHQAELAALYGDWEVPWDEASKGHAWNTGRDSPAIVERVAWLSAEMSWDGSCDGV